jgi:hypothetical protein
MSLGPKGVEPAQILSGWKEVANYLGKGVRTVQRYERQLGLPVRRPAGKPRGSVVATKAELDGWVAACPIQHIFSLGTERDSRYAALATSIQNGLDQMTKLRDQMAALRGEVRESVKVLRQSVHNLQGELIPGSWAEPSTSSAALRRRKILSRNHPFQTKSIV